MSLYLPVSDDCDQHNCCRPAAVVGGAADDIDSWQPLLGSVMATSQA